MKKTLRKVIYYCTGSIILSFGITLSILSELGAGAFDALNSNSSKLLNTSMGNAMYLSIFIVYIITMLLKPKKIYVIGMLLTSLIGVGINIWAQILPDVDYSMWVRVLFFCGSLIFLPLGVTFIIRSKLPLGPMDNLLLILVEKTNWSVAVIKTLIEGSYAVIALIFGICANIGMGAVSIGTIIITLTVGPVIEFFMKFIKDIENVNIDDKRV
ncbi:hypothetical protein KHQ81_04735 [Mycoplasmatota bacterium]|nr:hypothetical protein KHQ81_04735 [Mycoplasmatota bacterium]